MNRPGDAILPLLTIGWLTVCTRQWWTGAIIIGICMAMNAFHLFMLKHYPEF